MTTQPKKIEQPSPRPDLDKLYKPVGIQAINAATICRKKVAPLQTKLNKH